MTRNGAARGIFPVVSKGAPTGQLMWRDEQKFFWF
jgi:hypothetical protein